MFLHKRMLILCWYPGYCLMDQILLHELSITRAPPKTKMEPENHPFEKETHLPNFHSWVPAVGIRECFFLLGHGKSNFTKLTGKSNFTKLTGKTNFTKLTGKTNFTKLTGKSNFTRLNCQWRIIIFSIDGWILLLVGRFHSFFWKSWLGAIFLLTLGPQKPMEKWRFSTPNIWGPITSKNEGNMGSQGRFQ